MMNSNKIIQPIHPGEILKEEFLVPNGLTSNQLAMQLRVPAGRITAIVNGQRAITSDTALRLAKFFGNTPEFWLNLQMLYDLNSTSDMVATRIEEEVRPLKR